MSKPILPPDPSTPIRISIPSDARVPSLPLNVQSPLPVRSNPNVNPYNAAPYRRAPVASTFAAAPMAEGGVSVADMVRAQKDGYLTSDGFQIAGPNYTQQIRKDAAGERYIAPPSMPTAGYAAAFYPYPSSKMKVGAALAGAPFPGGRTPAWVKQSKYYIPESPAEHRKAQMATLMGLGAAEFADTDKYVYADSDWFQNTPAGETRPDYKGHSCLASVSDDPEPSQTFLTDCTLSAPAAKAWANYCNNTYAGQTSEAQNLRRLCKIVPSAFPAPPWSVAGKNQRGLSSSLEDAWKLAEKAYAELEKRNFGGDKTGGGGSGGGTLLPGIVTVGPITLDQPEADESNPWLWPLVGVVGVAALVWALKARNR